MRLVEEVPALDFPSQVTQVEARPHRSSKIVRNHWIMIAGPDHAVEAFCDKEPQAPVMNLCKVDYDSTRRHRNAMLHQLFVIIVVCNQCDITFRRLIIAKATGTVTRTSAQ